VPIGNSSGRDVDKFSAFALTPVPASRSFTMGVVPSLNAQSSDAPGPSVRTGTEE
jgi:hypothetical protein